MKPQKYHVVVSPVRELSLVGTADADYWTAQLRKCRLRPTVVDGRAQLVLTGIETKFMGLTFREFSMSVFVSRTPDGGERDGAYLLQAWNSRRGFAWVERTFFHTPYAYGNIAVIGTPPTSVQVAEPSGTTVMALTLDSAAGTSMRAPLRAGEEVWEGPIFLPGEVAADGSRRLFFARLNGAGAAYGFRTTADKIRIEPCAAFPALQQLIDSNFVGREWLVRPTATHGKAKTVRAALAGFAPT